MIGWPDQDVRMRKSVLSQKHVYITYSEGSSQLLMKLSYNTLQSCGERAKKLERRTHCVLTGAQDHTGGRSLNHNVGCRLSRVSQCQARIGFKFVAGHINFVSLQWLYKKYELWLCCSRHSISVVVDMERLW